MNDPLQSNQWYLTKINTPTVWDLSSGSNTIVAVLDSGIDYNHPDLIAQIIPGWNFYDNNNDVMDTNGHGTAVSGVIASSSNNAIGIASIAYMAKLMPVRIADPTGYAYWSTIAEGLSWAVDNGARVANISYAVSNSYTIQSAAQYMRSKNGIVIVSAGNTGVEESIAPSNSLITVSATNINDVKTSWSSYGSYVDVSAPGENIYTTVNGGGYGYWWGTSFSSPIVAGVAALIKSKYPDITATQLDYALINGTIDLGTVGKDNLYGYGRIDANLAVLAVPEIIIDNIFPIIKIIQPLDNSVLIGKFTNIVVECSDNIELNIVNLIIDNKTVLSGNTCPINYKWNTRNILKGTHTIEIVVQDTSYNTTRRYISVVKK